ncbi:MAG: hypothetical protein IJ796_10675 [Lachnospiraceae bacterium]|nr:hypothetical protein [Lachnospiraceae bacterium]
MNNGTKKVIKAIIPIILGYLILIGIIVFLLVKMNEGNIASNSGNGSDIAITASGYNTDD